MRILDRFADVRAEGEGTAVGLVPTMGYLHEGHLSLAAVARERSDLVVMSLFVNPLQFDTAADLDRYPRDLDRDAALAESAGVDVLFAPAHEEVFPSPPLTSVVVENVTDRMEGSFRPGHFGGVATVVTKLFAGIQPDVAIFGRKDAQQLALVTTIGADLSFPVEVVGAPTLRAADGLALSSRNIFLGDGERVAARGLSQGLFAAADLVADGERGGSALEDRCREIATAAGAQVEYVELAAADDASRLGELTQPAFLAMAGRVGSVRLIDNVFLWPDGSADRGAVLDGQSVLEGG